VNRRQFVSRVSMCAAAASVATATPSARARSTSGFTLRFVGMMGFVERTDGSFLVATPGQNNHVSHQPFLMARAGSRVATALDMRPAHGVLPGAFDMQLEDADPDGFVYRCLDHTSLDVVSGNTPHVANESTQMAQLSSIVPGARVRGNIEAWATSRVFLRGGRIEDSSAHPDAGRVWSFGDYRQRLTDAVNFQASGAELRLTSGSEARTFTSRASDRDELWVISAAMPGEIASPTRLEHSGSAFDYLAEATPVVAECAEARGREVPPTALPCTHPTSASTSLAAGGRTFPPYSELCFIMMILAGKGR
jgi:hypothetical protein